MTDLSRLIDYDISIREAKERCDFNQLGLISYGQQFHQSRHKTTTYEVVSQKRLTWDRYNHVTGLKRLLVFILTSYILGKHTNINQAKREKSYQDHLSNINEYFLLLFYRR